MIDIFNPIKDELKEVEILLEEKTSATVKHIEGATKHILSAGGKRLRPTLTILTSQLGDAYDKKRSIQVSYAVEYIHMASLIHDDIIDNAETRRGKPSSNVVFGSHYCVLLGDYLFSKSLFDLSIYETRDVSSTILEATNKMCEGQILQVLMNRKIDITEDEYFEVIRNKTAILIAGGCKAAGLISGQTDEKIKKLWDFGINIGIAFQISDDILDVISSPEKLGKPAGSDVREGSYTLPLIHALEIAPSFDCDKIISLLKKIEIDEKDWGIIKNFIEKYKGVEYAMDKGKKHVESAKKSLENFRDCQAKKILEYAADYCIRRTY
ncbi:polyprenyl synthetase family protein [Candidatus Desantisbacteria bacterium]|nr:polyprenyl synthetase family protein [Candidatus Desantisbacteria bacterium]